MKGFKKARLGAIGARPGNFNTMRFSEKMLQANGISVVTVDFSELFGHANRLSDDDAAVKDKLSSIRAYAKSDSVPPPSLVRIASWGSRSIDG